VRIGGMAKGAGMIHPQMATMIAVVTTDVQVPPGELSRMLRRTSDRTFNCLTVDGDTSTNDTVLALA
jgi:glutamate N-acetyltransferase / amino-acid N-acetyltransferase